MAKRRENKKIKNATECSLGDIQFKSITEKSFYKELLENGFNVEYEPTTFVLIDRREVAIEFYDSETKEQHKKRVNGLRSPLLLHRQSKVLRPIRYTPDFYFKYNDVDIYIEAKGFENDTFYLKKKLFISLLEDLRRRGVKSMYFEVHTKAQLHQAIKIIKDMDIIKEIEELLPSLGNKKDIALGEKYLFNRDFSSLSYLIRSVIKKTSKECNDQLLTLEMKLDMYLMQLEGVDEE